MKLRLVYVFSLAVLAFLLVYISWGVFGVDDDALLRSSEQVHIDLDGGDIAFNFKLQNREGRDLRYTYYFYLNDKLIGHDTLLVSVNLGYGIRLDPGELKMNGEGVAKCRLVIYREGEPEPIADVTRYIQAPEDEDGERFTF